eukprot:SAG22_NODE_635_length_8370_cov_33.081127_3_plen_161_part_00
MLPLSFYLRQCLSVRFHNNRTQGLDKLKQAAVAGGGGPDDADGGGGGGGGGEDGAAADLGISALCVRLSSVHFVIEQCDELLQKIIEGAHAQNYTGKPLDDAMDGIKTKLQGHCGRISEHIGAYTVFAELRAEIVEQLYSPAPSAARAGPCIDAIENVLG